MLGIMIPSREYPSEKELNRLLRNYANGIISKSELHLLEKVALDDPFVMEALEGYTAVPNADLSILDRQLEHKVNSKTKPIVRPVWIRWAAAVIGIGVLFGMYNHLRRGSDNENTIVVQNTEVPQEESKQDIANDTYNEMDVMTATEPQVNQRKNDPPKQIQSDTKKKVSKPTSYKPGTVEVAAPTNSRYDETPTVSSSDPESIELAKAEQMAQQDIATSTYSRVGNMAYPTTDTDMMRDMGVRVVDKLHQQPITGATIKVGNLSQSSGVDGLARIQYRQGTGQPLMVSHEGFEDKEIALDTYQAFRTIELTPVAASIPELLAIAMPDMGIDAFEQFVQSQLNPHSVYDQSTGMDSHKVTVRFIILSDGSLSDFNTVGSPMTEHHKRLIDMLQASGKWKALEKSFPLTATYSYTF